MGIFIKYLSLFIVFGILWFMIFSIQISKSTTIFVALQKELKMVPEEEDETGGKKAIDREKVIDAISKAFNQ